MSTRRAKAQEAGPPQPERWISDRDWTPEQRSAEMRAFGERLKADPVKARAFLQRAGILDAAGELAEAYRV